MEKCEKSAEAICPSVVALWFFSEGSTCWINQGLFPWISRLGWLSLCRLSWLGAAIWEGDEPRKIRFWKSGGFSLQNGLDLLWRLYIAWLQKYLTHNSSKFFTGYVSRGLVAHRHPKYPTLGNPARPLLASGVDVFIDSTSLWHRFPENDLFWCQIAVPEEGRASGIRGWGPDINNVP